MTQAHLAKRDHVPRSGVGLSVQQAVHRCSQIPAGDRRVLPVASPGLRRTFSQAQGRRPNASPASNVQCRRSPGVLLHRGANELIEVEEELATQVWFVARREYNWNRFGLHISF